MSRIHIQRKLEKCIDGLMFTASVRKDVDIDIEDLDFGTSYTIGGDGDAYLLSPRDVSPMKEMHGIFPPEEWRYTFFTRGENLSGKDLPDRPYLYLELEPVKGGKPVIFDIDFLSEADYRYLYGLFGEMFPDAKLFSLEEYYEEQIVFKITDRDNASALGHELSDMFFVMKDDDLDILCKSLCSRRAEYLKEGSVYFDTREFFQVLGKEMISAFLNAAKKAGPAPAETRPGNA